MEIAKPCLNAVSQTHYGVTINIAPYKSVHGKRWDKHDEHSQKSVLLNALYTYIGSVFLQAKGITYEFEKTNKGNIHIHALFVGWEPESMKSLQMKFHIDFSYANCKPERTFFYEETKVHRKYWESYMRKYVQKLETSEDL